MIESIDSRVLKWAGTVVSEVELSLSAPNGVAGKPRVHFYLFELADGPPAQTVSGKVPPLQISLRYLVTVTAEDTEVAHRRLGELIFAAMEHPEFRVDLKPLGPEFYASFEGPPRPAFVLDVPLMVERRTPESKQVRSLRLRSSPMRPVDGAVLGPQETPITGARVELPSLHLTTRTDAKGRFRFSAVPVDPPPTTLTVRAKGRELSLNPSDAFGADEPWLIRFESLET